MPGEISVTLMRRLCKACMGGILLASVACFSAPADAAKAQLNSKVPPGKWKAVRLKNLPEGASLGVKVIATGSLVVILIREAELKRYPEPVSPVFQGTLDKTLTFSVVIPESGHYFVILDNRRGASERQVRVLIQAQAPKSRDKPAAESNTKKEKI
jgi:hypothetical protein